MNLISKNKLLLCIIIPILILVIIGAVILISNNRNNSSKIEVPKNEEKPDIPVDLPVDGDKEDEKGDDGSTESPNEPTVEEPQEKPDNNSGNGGNTQIEDPKPEPQPEPKPEPKPEPTTLTSFPVLAYHNFMTKENKRLYAPHDKYTMSIEDFDTQLNYLYNNGYHTIDYSTLYKWLTGQIELDKKSFMITIDDANISAYHLAIPVIEKYGFSAVIFVITGRVNPTSRPYDPSAISFFGDDIINDIKENHKSIILGSHSKNLHDLINGQNPKDILSYDELLSDLSNSRQYLDTKLFAYPFGMYNENYLNAAKNAGFDMAFTFKPSGRARRTNSVYEIPRININDEIYFEKFKRLVETEW